MYSVIKMLLKKNPTFCCIVVNITILRYNLFTNLNGLFTLYPNFDNSDAEFNSLY